jgi:hypothetical protein
LPLSSPPWTPAWSPSTPIWTPSSHRTLLSNVQCHFATTIIGYACDTLTNVTTPNGIQPPPDCNFSRAHHVLNTQTSWSGHN